MPWSVCRAQSTPFLAQPIGSRMHTALMSGIFAVYVACVCCLSVDLRLLFLLYSLRGEEANMAQVCAGDGRPPKAV